jgi:succinate dehydrogenase/fumarate reductase flavoprotein subunit
MAVNLEQLADEVIETDFLIVGGGLAGCMAAIMAREQGNIDVAIMDRANIKTSGQLPYGLMGWPVHHPKMTGLTPEQEALMGRRPVRTGGLFDKQRPEAETIPPGHMQQKGIMDWKLGMSMFRHSAKIAAKLEEIDLKLREGDGTYKIHREMGSILSRGIGELKAKLASGATKSGTRIFNRTILTSLLTKDGTVVGATGLNIRTGNFLVFKAKVVLVATGAAQRVYLYPHEPYPTNLVYGLDYPGNHGGGIAAAYRAGAKLANMEFLFLTGASAAGGAWAYKHKNSKGEFLEDKYPEASQAKTGSFFPNTGYLFSPNMLNPEIERDVIVYDASKATEVQVMSGIWYNTCEIPMLVKVRKLRGDPRKAPPYELRLLNVGLMRSFSGVMPLNDTAEASIKNLFVAGDTASGTGGGGPGAVGWGYIVGINARERALEAKKPVFTSEQVKQVAVERARVMVPLGRKGDSPWELEDYVRTINMNYIYIRKTEPRLKRAIELHKIARERFTPNLGAANPHELMRCLEVQDIIDISEMHAYASLIRKETRFSPSHYRVDYPERDNEHWQKAIILQNVDGEMKYTLEERG